MGDRVRVKTFIGRELTGTLCHVHPKYGHDLGAPQEQILSIGNEAKVIELFFILPV